MDDVVVDFVIPPRSRSPHPPPHPGRRDVVFTIGTSSTTTGGARVDERAYPISVSLVVVVVVVVVVVAMKGGRRRWCVRSRDDRTRTVGSIFVEIAPAVAEIWASAACVWCVGGLCLVHRYWSEYFEAVLRTAICGLSFVQPLF